VLAHGVESPAGIALFTILIVGSTAAGAVYLAGARRLRRGTAGRRTLPPWRVGSFATALVVAVVAVSPPVDELAHRLFVAHMAQHLVLAFVVAPLLVLGRPILVCGAVIGRTLALPRRWRRFWVRHRRSMVTALLLAAVHAFCWYLWHLPGPYDLALRNPLVHGLEHAMLVLSGVVLCWHALIARPVLAAVAGALVSMLAVAPLAAMLVFAARPWYVSHLVTDSALSPLEDQQLGGALMWFPGSLAYLLAVAMAVVRHLNVVPAPPIHSSPPAPQSVDHERVPLARSKRVVRP
jgi:putative membrane protein